MINCMALTPACCVTDELSRYEIDNTRYGGAGGAAAGSRENFNLLENSIMKRKNSDARFSQQFNNIDATNGTENLVLSDDEDFFGDEEEELKVADEAILNDKSQHLDCQSEDG